MAACPIDVLELKKGIPKLKGECISCGLCYYQCPQFVGTEELADVVFGEGREPKPVGEYEGAYSAVATDSEIRERGQDGGVVTALLTTLLEGGFIDGAVVTVTSDEPWNPKTVVATSREEVVQGSGSIYTRGPQVLGVKEAIDRHDLENIAFVGVPCQIKAIRTMESGLVDQKNLRSKIKLLIGIFCTESFSYSSMQEIAEKEFEVGLGDVRRMDIDKGNFVLYLDDGSKREKPIKELKEYATAPCSVCDDYTAELADISVGSVGAPSGKCAVLTRTQVGVDAFDHALKSGALEDESLEDVKPGIGLLERLSSRKKEESSDEAEERKSAGESLPPSL